MTGRKTDWLTLSYCSFVTFSRCLLRIYTFTSEYTVPARMARVDGVVWRCIALVHVILASIHASRAQFIDNDVVGEEFGSILSV